MLRALPVGLPSSSRRSGSVEAEQQLLAQLVNGLALLVHDVVVFEQVLADVEVALLDLALRVLDALASPTGATMGSLSGMPMRSISDLTRSPAKMRIRSSSSDR